MPAEWAVDSIVREILEAFAKNGHLDYGENIRRHGPVDRIRVRASHGGAVQQDGEPPVKRCPGCGQLVEVAFPMCPECGHMWEEMMAKHRGEASCLSPLSLADGQWHDVAMTWKTDGTVGIWS